MAIDANAASGIRFPGTRGDGEIAYWLFIINIIAVLPSR